MRTKPKQVIVYQRSNPDTLIDCTTIDGYTFEFQYKDIKAVLNLYPKDANGWFFNSTRDRYIAECFHDCISVNPQLLYQNNYEIVL